MSANDGPLGSEDRLTGSCTLRRDRTWRERAQNAPRGAGRLYNEGARYGREAYRHSEHELVDAVEHDQRLGLPGCCRMWFSTQLLASKR